MTVSSKQAKSYAGELCGLKVGEDRVVAVRKMISTMKTLNAPASMIKDAESKLADMLAARTAREIIDIISN